MGLRFWLANCTACYRTREAEDISLKVGSSLPARNLIRGWRLSLPSGQHVAEAMGVTPIADNDILIGKGVDKQDPADPPIVSIDKVDDVFKNNGPLWTYILAEAMKPQANIPIPVQEKISITTPQLGPVGARIVAEVFLGLMFGDNNSLLNLEPTWNPGHTPYMPSDPARLQADGCFFRGAAGSSFKAAR